MPEDGAVLAELHAEYERRVQTLRGVEQAIADGLIPADLTYRTRRLAIDRMVAAETAYWEAKKS